MTRHLRNQHAMNPHVCPTCGKCLETLAELQKHKITHKVRILTCSDCLEVFADSHAFSLHVASHIQSQSTPKQSFQTCDATEVKLEGLLKDDGECSNGDSRKEAEEESAQNSDANETDQDTIKEKYSRRSKKDYFCPICVNKRFTGSNKLARHMRTHTKEKPFTCPVCALTFSQSYHMTRHVRKQHNLGQYICTKCGISYSSWLELKTHRKTHAVEGLTCLACDTSFKEKSALTTHLKTHKSIEKGTRSLTCSDCGREFGRLYHLKRHILTHRKDTLGEFYICPDCQKSFLEEHMVVHQKTYSCSTCGKKFKVEYALKKHEQAHEHAQYYCSLCCKHFLKLSHYKRHLIVHKKRESRCPHCPTVFLQLTAFKYHLRTHTEERPYQCSCCIETFEVREDLEKHCLKHRKFKKERPYLCSRCDNAFALLEELTKHMTIHEGEQPLCSQCDKSFRTSSGLRLHNRLHMDAPPTREEHANVTEQVPICHHCVNVI
uniref:C2H2-type domain-containing protein n=1 Tax=Gouania willdenowi TaxID=441366 RepID=A0A8C5G5P7_GOUWI